MPRAKFVLVTVEVKNVGRVSVDPFCGGGGNTLIDTKGRNFDTDSQTNIGIPGNNTCDSLQPSFKATFKLAYMVPKGSKPIAVGLLDSNDTNDYSGDTWVRVWF